MKEKIKSVVSNGFPYGVIFFILSCILGYLFRVNWQTTFLMAGGIGGAALLFNGSLYNRFAKHQKKLDNISIELEESESVIEQAPANHLIEESLVPGKLFLTRHRIIFKSYGTNDKPTQEYFWNLKELTPLKFYSSIWNKGGEFLLRAENGNSIMFEVDKLKEWKILLSNFKIVK